MNPNESEKSTGGGTPQNSHNADASGISLLKTLEPSLWNSSLGRRTFLKRTGAATVGTAIALHGFKTEVLASESDPNDGLVTELIFKEEIFYGTFYTHITLPPGMSNPPTASELATYLNSHPEITYPVSGSPNNYSTIGLKTTKQNFVADSPYPQHHYQVIKSEIGSVASFDLSEITVTGNSTEGWKVWFKATNVKWRWTEEHYFIGDPEGDPWTEQTPADPIYPAFP